MSVNTKQQDNFEDGDCAALCEQYNMKIEQYITGGYISLGLALGEQLGLFEKLVEADVPLTSHQIADLIRCKERYTRELLGLLAVADIVSFVEEDEKLLYHIPQSRKKTLKDNLKTSVYVPLMASSYDKLLSCFQTNGPLGLNDDDIHPIIDYWLKNRDEYFSKIIPLLPLCSADSKVCLDIGCGNGTLLNKVARYHPKSSFYGIDVNLASINKAKEDSKEIKNVVFDVQEATALPADWSEKFDYIFMFNVLHNLPFANKALKECYRVLKPSGSLSIMELDVKSSMCEQKEDMNFASRNYTMSLFYCLSTSLATPGSNGLGASIGYPKLCKMIEEEGFKDVEVKHFEDISNEVNIIATK